MYFDINTIIKRELHSMKMLYETIEAEIQKNLRSKADGKTNSKSNDGQLISMCTSEGIVYHLRKNQNGKRLSRKLGGDDDKTVILIKQTMFNKELVRRLKKDIRLLSQIEGKFLSYDPDSVDKGLGEVYRDSTGLVNKAPGLLSLEEWNGINRKNDYKMAPNGNVAPDGMNTRSKSEIIVYCILRGYGLLVKYDMKIKVKDDTGQIIEICPDFIILCPDGRLIIVEHLGMLDKNDYLNNAFRRIHLYLINGYKLNVDLFLTADHAVGKIDSQAVDELVRKMILPKVRGTGGSDISAA